MRKLNTMKKRRSGTSGGFTLIELLGVIAVMIIISSIIIGGYFAMMTGYATRSALNHMKGALELAKQRASISRRRVYFFITADEEAGRYEYSVVEAIGRISDATLLTPNGILRDEFTDLSSFRPDLIYSNSPAANKDYMEQTFYNLGSEKTPLKSTDHIRFRLYDEIEPDRGIDASVIGAGWVLRVRRETAGGLESPVKTGDWDNGDRYGWEVYPPLRLPLGFRFGASDPVMQTGTDMIYFTPNGTPNETRIFTIAEEMVAGDDDANEIGLAFVKVAQNGKITIGLKEEDL